MHACTSLLCGLFIVTGMATFPSTCYHCCFVPLGHSFLLFWSLDRVGGRSIYTINALYQLQVCVFLVVYFRPVLRYCINGFYRNVMNIIGTAVNELNHLFFDYHLNKKRGVFVLISASDVILSLESGWLGLFHLPLDGSILADIHPFPYLWLTIKLLSLPTGYYLWYCE